VGPQFEFATRDRNPLYTGFCGIVINGKTEGALMDPLANGRKITAAQDGFWRDTWPNEEMANSNPLAGRPSQPLMYEGKRGNPINERTHPDQNYCAVRGCTIIVFIRNVGGAGTGGRRYLYTFWNELERNRNDVPPPVGGKVVLAVPNEKKFGKI